MLASARHQVSRLIETEPAAGFVLTPYNTESSLSHSKRQRYWARSMVGWKGVDAALPNANHYSLAALERLGKIDTLITQNVDRLHQRAGSQNGDRSSWQAGSSGLLELWLF